MSFQQILKMPSQHVKKETGMTGKPAPQDISHAPVQGDVLHLLEQRTRQFHHQLAGNANAGDEVLGFLAQHGEPATRRAVAANPTTPAEADVILAEDEDAEVRAELARKIARIMPGLSAREGAHILALTIEALEKLAHDAETHVRAVLAEEIKHLDCVPKHIVSILAQDAEIVVAGPILEYSPLLSDADLIEIIAYSQASEVISAIARRKPVSEDVSDAIVTSLDVPGIAALLTNPNAKIRQETMEQITSYAEKVSQWHMPLTIRLDLSGRALRRIASFVGSGLLDKLAERNGLDDDMRAYLNKQVRARIQAEENPNKTSAMQKAAATVAEARRNGRLDDAFVENAAEGGSRETVIVALSELARVPADTVRRMLLAGTAKPITALVWRAGLSMRVAFKIQSFVMKLPARELLPARGGVRFPLSEKEMRWHLSYFDVTV
jgi:uncharacterized protein (DUF2336 family)